MTKDHDHSRDFIALNNTSISLLERFFFDEALATFRDALAVMQTAVVEDQEAKREANVNHILLRAEAALARASKPLQQHNRGFLLTVLSDDHTDTAMERAAYDMCSAESGFVIRINHENTTDGCCNEIYLDLEPSIVLMNFGTACRCAHNFYQHQEQHEQDEIRNSTFLKMAHVIFSLAHGMLSRHQDRLEDYIDEVSRSRRLHVHMLIVQNLMVISNDSIDRRMYYGALCQLRDELHCHCPAVAEVSMAPGTNRSRAPAA